MFLAEHGIEVLQRRVLRPQAPRGGRVAFRNGEQEQVVQRNQRPQQHRDAHQQQLGLGRNAIALHLDSLFIIT